MTNTILSIPTIDLDHVTGGAADAKKPADHDCHDDDGSPGRALETGRLARLADDALARANAKRGERKTQSADDSLRSAVSLPGNPR